MSFKTFVNRILVKDTTDKTTLDTDQPMPHILQTAVASVSVAFPTATSTPAHAHTDTPYGFQYQDCQQQYVCGPQQVCVWETRNGTYGYYCDTKTVCEWKQVCTTKTGYRWDRTCWAYRDYQAREWEQVNNIASILNGIDADFIQVKVSGSRTVAGEDPWYGTFVSTIPSGEFLSQGTFILESSFQTGGASWLRRIMSVYVEGGVVKVKFKSSNKAISNPAQNNSLIARWYDPPSQGTSQYWSDPDNPAKSFASSFSLTFHVTIGKFTQ